MIRVASALLLALTLAACGGSDGSTPVGDEANVSVTNSSPEEVYAGEPVTFVISVTNEGPASASDVELEHHLNGGNARLGTITCSATGSAECPAPLGATMTLSNLPAGGGLVFHFEVLTDPDWRGSVTSALIASADADNNHSNNIGESTTQEVDKPAPPDLRNGDYAVFASNGRQYTLSLNFNDMSYHMLGSQVNRTGTFTRDVDEVSYVFAGTARFRIESDLVVGGFDFNFGQHIYDHGVRPFVAARQFTTDTAPLVGVSYNLLGLNLRRNDKLESVVLPSVFGNGVLQSCRAPVPVKVDLCPEEFLYTYSLTVAGSEITGADENRNDVIHFRLAQSGSSLILLQADDAADGTGRQFRVGLADTTGLAGGSFATSSTSSAWGPTTLSNTSYAFAGKLSNGTAVNETAVLAPLTNAGPAGLRRGNRASDSAPIYLGQNDVLMLMLVGADDPAEGTMDIGLH
jgi:uncharacterized repeat protein (TIGR01451 family)